jgi:hypothetical protein
MGVEILRAELARSIRCPGCRSETMFPVEQFLAAAKEQPFGPWPCASPGCRTVLRGVVHADGTVDVESQRSLSRQQLDTTIKARGVVEDFDRGYGRATVRLDDDRIVYFPVTAFHGARGQQRPYLGDRVTLLYNDDSGHVLAVVLESKP